MFRRRDSQKPSDTLISQFRREFPDVTSHSSLSTSTSALDAPAQDPQVLLNLNQFQDQYQDLEKTGIAPDFQNPDHLPPEWRTTFLGGGSLDMPDMQGAFFPGTPTPGPDGSAQKHTTAFSGNMGVDTPVSASASTGHFFPSRSHSLSLSDPTFAHAPGALQQASTFPQMHGGFPPHLFENQRSQHLTDPDFGVNAFNVNAKQSGLDATGGLENEQAQPGWDYPSHESASQFILKDDEDSDEQFRFRTTLKAATAMVRNSNETPVTYLNKSQLYEISIVDRRAEPPVPYDQAKYRTAIRIAFDDEQMRRRPESAWKLWWDGRGKDEAYKRGGKRQAVEFATPEGGQDGGRSASIHLVNETFDGFSVDWSPAPGRPVDCSLHMRFNFLSTDFSLSKGVKGCSVRLCSKTEVLNPSLSSSAPTREICYCNVKTFRDHGAERKLQNDKLHATKQIERVQKQIDQADAEDQEGLKRKRRSSYVGGRPSKVARARRASASTNSSDDDNDMGSDDLRKKLRSYQDMPSSMKSESRLYLRGEEQDDLDTHPVILPGQPLAAQGLSGSFQPPSLRHGTPHGTSSSTHELCSQPSSVQGKPMGAQRTGLYPTPPHLASQSSSSTRPPSNRFSSHPDSHPEGPQLASPMSTASSKLYKSPSRADEAAAPSIEVKDLDPSYNPPSSPHNRPVCCLFVKPTISGHRVEDDNYRALYLKQRTLEEFIMTLTTKCGLEPSSVASTVRVNERGLQIRVEDEMIREMPEQQDLLAEFDPIELTHDSADELFKVEEEGDVTPSIKYQLTLRY